MSPRIDPVLPVVWRSPTELQFGATPRVVLRDPGALETGLISALRHGASESTLETIGIALGGTPEAVRALLERLGPAFEPATDAAAFARSRRRVAVDAPRVLGDRVAEHLAMLGYEPVSVTDGGIEVEGTAFAVIAATWVVSPARHLPWLRADVPHLAVVFDDEGTRVGPLIEPGDGPCLRCLELARRDGDPAWPVIAAQLAGRPAASCTPRAVHDVAALVASLVDDRLAGSRNGLRGASIRLGRPGESAAPTQHPWHPECGCRAPAGSATAPVRLDTRRPGAASSARGAAVPA